MQSLYMIYMRASSSPKAKCGLTLGYLKYHEELHFRGLVTTRAVAHAHDVVYSESMSVYPDWFRRLHENALFCKIAMQELEQLGFALWGMDWTWSIEPCRVNVSCPLSWNFLSTQGPIHSVDYCRRWSGTGSEFVEGPKKRGGKPRRTPMEGRTSCQWLVCYMCDPETGRILHTSMMLEPEGNETVLEALEDSLWPYPSAIASCMVKPVQWWSPPNKSLRWPSWSYCVVDSFHAHRHSKKCQCNPCRLASFWSQLEPQP